MKHICSGCGSEIPEGQDFCYACGAWAKNSYDINDEGTVLYNKTCVRCGTVLTHDAEFCSHCGAKVTDSQIPINLRRSNRLTKIDIIAILLAVIPGLFNIFGLGQIIQRRWSKAFVYICTTALLLYISPTLSEQSNGQFLLIVLQIGFFLVSVMDVFKGIATRGS